MADYHEYETTEKANLSYWIGMTLAGVVADQLLNVPRLHHATRQSGIRKTRSSSRSLADLVGLDSTNAWHVVEAKGRQKAPTQADLTKWKNQACTISTINNQPIATGSCSYTVFYPHLLEAISDPSPSKRVNLTIDPAEFGSKYYTPYLDFLSTGASKLQLAGASVSVKIIAFDPVKQNYVYVGLDDAVIDGVNSGSIPFKVREYVGLDAYIGTDGIAVVTNSSPCAFP